jgi:hypothetical protein
MPARLREIIQICAQYFEISVTKPKKGSHWKATRKGCRPYPITAHNGERTEIPDEYIRGLCRNFGIEYDEMKRLLSQ